ncbi:HDOD domain-containing protein [Noviherbaspirillum massiliense]|uniref:HDOD domain-containing protein n=1 Tax=Noviherbaspirillum massiliense TaxID=1465823 RepID=UPI0002DDF971|nr:HDOD domain-containing protein [Noviherbaspirillum massiliense]
MHQSDADIYQRLSAAHLPTLPQVLARLVSHCEADAIDRTGLAELIAMDPAMTAKVLAAASAIPAFHRPGLPASLRHALTVLDPGLVKTLIVAESVRHAFDLHPPADAASLLRFWKDSLLAAHAARMLAERIGYGHGEESYLAGLLHEIGHLALSCVTPAGMPKVSPGSSEGPADLHARISQAGAALIRRWNGDPFLADSVLYRLGPAARLEHAHPLIRIVFAARLLANGASHAASGLDGAAALLGMDVQELAGLQEQASEEVGRAAASLGIDLATTDGKAPAKASRPPGMGPDAAREKLSAHVRSLALFSETGRCFAKQRDRKSLLDMVSRSARILFDFRDDAVLMLDHGKHVLSVLPGSGRHQRLAELCVPLISAGPLAEAATERRVTFMLHDGSTLGIHEEQLLRIFGSECLVCLPLVAQDRCLGVFVGVAESWQLEALRASDRLLHAFGLQAAAALDALLSERSETERQAAFAAGEFRNVAQRVAHEVNNPLAIIRNYLSVLDRKLIKQEPVNTDISILIEEIDRVGQIMNGLTRLQTPAPGSAAEINRVIHDVVRLFRDMEYAPPSVQIAVRTPDEPFMLDCDPNLVKQILVNLVKNAVEAMPNGGEIKIQNNGFVNQDGALYVGLWIRDTGPGIPKDMMANLFTQVRSTKGNGHRGLGLSIVHGLVQDMQGRITCHSNKKGTAFEILLPVSGLAGPAANPGPNNGHYV